MQNYKDRAFLEEITIRAEITWWESAKRVESLESNQAQVEHRVHEKGQWEEKRESEMRVRGTGF